MTNGHNEPSQPAPREIEAKIALEPGELDLLRERLRSAGAEPGPVEDEENYLFDLPSGRIRGSDQTLRVRCFDGRTDALLTHKGPPDRASRYKSRQELEVRVSNGATVRRILKALGFRAISRYRKRREHWRLDGAAIALDEIDLGPYIEVEGDEHVIDSVLARLGLEQRPLVREGYASLARRGAASIPKRRRKEKHGAG